MTNTRKLVFVAILSALSFLLMLFQFPLIPAADFLQMDLSVLPMLLALVMYGPGSALTVLVLRSLLKLFLNNAGVSTYIGLPMNIAAMAVFILVFALLWNKRKTLKAYVSATLVASILMTMIMVLLNYFYAVPLYAKFANFDIEQILGLYNYLVLMVVPFNLLQGLILALAFYLVYLAAKPIVERYQ